MKKSLIFALALMLVLSFAGSAFAAQAFGPVITDTVDTTIVGDTYYTYTPTVKTFTADGTTNYPYEIYLPNENPEGYKIHSSYTKNTDACASCHSIHTAMNEMLLQWYTTYDTCMACHDGTIATTYDVANGYTAEDTNLVAAPGARVPAAGGMFGYTGSEAGLSKHNVVGEVTNAGAPGGGIVADSKGTWTSEFSCDGCHDPHGVGGNARLLKGDVNGAATEMAETNKFSSDPSGTIATTNGLAANSTGTAASVYKNGVVGGTEYLNKTYYAAKPDSLDDLYVYTGTVSYTLANAQPYLFPVKGVTMWVYSTGAAGKWAKATSTNYLVDNQLGYTRVLWIGSTAAPAAANVRLVGVPQFRVVMKINNYLNNGGVAERVYHISGINPFCGGCHTDYNTASYEVYNIKAATTAPGKEITSMSSKSYETGAYSKAHRHTVARSGSTAPGMAEGVEYPLINVSGDYTKTNLSCLGCHVAHGAGTSWWNNYLVDRAITGPSGDLWTTAETTEIAGSSALKRMPNMGVCQNCHNMQASQVGYAANSGQGAFVSGTPYVASQVKQANATYVGSSYCFRCHPGAVQEWVETQHNMFAPLNNELAGNYLKAFVPGTSSADAVYTGFTTAESIALLDELQQATEAFGFVELVKEDALAKGFVNEYNEKISEKDIFTVGQLPVGTRAGMEAVREYIARYYNQGTKQYEYSVAGVATWNPTLGEWEIEGGELEGADNYTGGCFNCHASLTNCDANAAGSATEAGKDNNRKTLDAWYSFLYEDGGRPGIDIGITCEACHGQASNHIVNPTAENITNPAKLTMKSQSQVCGRCHVSSGNKNAITTQYSVWKLDNNTAITPGSVKDLVYAGPYANLYWNYNTYGTQMDAYFSAGWEAYTDAGNQILPVANPSSTSASEWTYKSHEGRVYFSGGHTQYTTFALSKHFSGTGANLGKASVSCVTCHASHGGNQVKFQLKTATGDEICAACHDTTYNVAKYMPIQSNNEVKMHDFGRVFDADTQLPINTNYLLTGYPRFE